MMKKEIVAIYPGSFDPFTNGHETIVQRAASLWSKIIVAVAAGHHKKTLFNLEERMDMIRHVMADYKNVEVHSFSGLLKDEIDLHQVDVIVRGVRVGSDFDYEFQMAGMNKHLMPDVETVFMMPAEHQRFTSSSFVREIGLLGGSVSGLVSPYVAQQLQRKKGNQ